LIRSMTGFARSARSGNWGEIQLELRAVNHRFLDLKVQVPEGLRVLEEEIRERLRKRLGRGHVEALLHWRGGGAAPITVNRALALEILAAARGLAQEAGGIETPIRDALRLLAWPGVIETAKPEIELLRPEVAALAEETLERLIGVREREGRALAAALGERLARLDATIARLDAERPSVEAALRKRLDDRLRALGAEVDPLRVAQEAALLVVRQDVSEELERLGIHAREVRQLLDADEPVGRRLDFLMQELVREANTLAAKAGDLDTSREALELKVVVEEMREQVQNVE
jgi:uncharacterized protein (TIGR00255 family)